MKILILTFLVISRICAGDVLAEGKTKVVDSYKDDITAGDGARHDVIVGKAAMANATTCNVFRLLKDCDIPIAFREQIDSHRFLADLCQMIPYEVVVRREAHGSYLKRYPHVAKGHVFPQLIVEFFLKTNHKKWLDHSLPKDDPLIHFDEVQAQLFLPHMPMETQTPFLILTDHPLKNQPEQLEEMASIAKKAFLILERAWHGQGGRLVDFKVEFGINSSGKLLLADVIDNDSWRVIQNEQYIDKQVYRDGGAIDEVTALYRHVTAATGRFHE
jgi:phosphoribosylaminoimidazole-succinocarboxamide synthase